MSRYAIVAIGYNRVDSMARLLSSLDKADYDGDEVPLIISIDNSGEDHVERYAKQFVWKHGPKQIRTYPKRQGLRRHVLSCGELLNDYDAVAVFEDDIYASPNFYHYMKQTVPFYETDERIAGISLYNHGWNVHANRPFMPLSSRYDVYFLQFAQSWGQIWMKKQWLQFREWYQDQAEEYHAGADVPEYVASWPSSSWLKYHIKYCIEMDKYFVYPYVSLSTNFTDAGENFTIPSTGMQVPLEIDLEKKYRLVQLDEAVVRYDAFWENQILADYLGVPKDDVCVDLYGIKQNREGCRYWLTMEIRDYVITRSFGLRLKPQEVNVIQNIEGTQIFLYDTAKMERNPYRNRVGRITCNYDYRGDNLALHTLKDLFFNKIKRQLRMK